MTKIRALLAVMLLAGFFVFAVGIVVGLLALAALVGHSAGAKLLVVAVLVAIGIGRALWQVFRQQGGSPEGVRLVEHQAPELFHIVRQLAAQVGTRPPDEIRLIPQVNAAVAEDTRWLGLKAGVRRMYVGVPLLVAFTVDQLRAVLAHELGHYSHSHTRLGEITYKGRVTIIRTAQNIGHSSFVGYLFRGYLWLYMLVSSAVSRRQELEADRAATRLAGRAATASALREVHVLDAAWDFFLANYVVAGHQRGYFPADLFGGFSELLAGRAGELARLRSSAPTDTTSRWDSHPALVDRLAAIAREPDLPVNADHRAAAFLVLDLPGVCREVEASVFEVGGRRVVPWPQFTAAAVAGVYQEGADELYRAAARVTGLEQAGLTVVFDLLAAGRLGELASGVGQINWADPQQRQTGAAAVAERLDQAVQLAAVRAGRAWWQHSWSGPVSLVGPDGRPIRFDELISGALADPSAVYNLRAVLARMGVNEGAEVMARPRHTAEHAELVAAMGGVRFDGQRHDLLILDEGLVLVPGGRVSTSEQRLRTLLASRPVAALAAGNRWLPYEEIAQATVERKVPLGFGLRLHDGSTHTLKLSLRSKPLGEAHKALVGGLARFVR